MDKAHALALVNALEGAKVPCSAVLSFDGAGAEGWTVTIPPSFALDGAHLQSLITYCANNGLAVSATFSYLGIT